LKQNYFQFFLDNIYLFISNTTFIHGSIMTRQEIFTTLFDTKLP
jgi:hypothetical protein